MHHLSKAHTGLLLLHSNVVQPAVVASMDAIPSTMNNAQYSFIDFWNSLEMRRSKDILVV